MDIFKLKLRGKKKFMEGEYVDSISAMKKAIEIFDGATIDIYRKRKYHKRVTYINAANQWRMSIRVGVLDVANEAPKFDFFEMLMGA